jgi:hypothetical protein
MRIYQGTSPLCNDSLAICFTVTNILLKLVHSGSKIIISTTQVYTAAFSLHSLHNLHITEFLTGNTLVFENCGPRITADTQSTKY